MKIKNKVNPEILIKSFLVIMLLIIIYFIPFTHDDWAWGSSIGIKRLKNFFSDYNGRWAGNLSVIILTRSRLLKTIVITTTIVLIIKFISKITDNQNKNIMYICAILLLLMPHRIIAQTIAWVSGFSNYVIPTILLLIYIFLNKNIFEKQESKLQNRYVLPMAVLGFVTSLFIENITIYNVILCVFFIGCEILYFKKVTFANIGYIIGSVAGTILMFSNSGYANVMNGTDSYRTIEQGNIIIGVVETYFETMYKYLIQNNLIIMLVIGVISLIIIYRYKKNNPSLKTLKKSIITFSNVVILSYIMYLIFIYVKDGSNIFINTKIKCLVEGIMALCFAFSVTTTLCICVEGKAKYRMLFEIISIFVIVAPLFIVTPIGPRNFYTIYIFFIILVCEMMCYLKIAFDNKYLIPIIVFLMSFYGIIYGQTYKIEQIRTDCLDTVKEGQEEIYVPNIPFSQYMQYPNPCNKTFIKRFKKFHNINDDIELIFIDYDEWINKEEM